MSDMFYGLVIRGLGQLATSGSTQRPYCFCAGDTSLATADYIPVPIVADTMVVEVGNKIDPRTGKMEVGDVEIPLILPEDPIEITATSTYGTVDPFPLFSSTRREATGLLAAELPDSDFADITLFSRSGSEFSVDDIIYLENETIHLTGLVSTSAINKTQTFSCDRGMFGSRRTYHTSNPGVGLPPSPVSGYDNRIWRIPEIVGSEAFVVEYNPKTESLDTIGSYVITKEPQFTGDMTGVKITCTSLFSVLSNRKLNNIPLGASGPVSSVLYSTRHQGIITRLPADDHTSRYGPIYKPQPDIESPRQLLQVPDDSLVSVDFVTHSVLSTPLFELSSNRRRYVSDPAKDTALLDSPKPKANSEAQLPNYEDTNQPQEEFREVLGFGYALRDKEGTAVGVQGEKVPFHAGDLWLMHLTSTGLNQNGQYDRLAYSHGMGIPQDLIDIDGIEDEINRSKDEGLVSVAIFGWDGSTYSPSDVKDKILVPFRFFPHTDAQGRISMSRFRAILPASDDVHEIPAANILKFSEGQRTGKDAVKLRLRAYWGYPWHKGSHPIDLIDQSGRGNFYNPDPPDTGFDIDVTAVGVGDANTINTRDVLAREHLENANRPIPTYIMTVVSDTPLHEGQRVKFTIQPGDYPHTSPYYGPDGYLIDQRTIYGYITNKAHKLGSSEYQVDVWALNETYVNTPKAIAPGFRVQSVYIVPGHVEVRLPIESFSGEPTIDIIDTLWGLDLQFGYVGGGIYFEMWHRKDGFVEWNAAGYEFGFVSAYKDETTYISLIFSSAPDTTPTTDHYLRLARRESSSGDVGRVVYSTFYAYIANEFGLFGDNIEGDIYV